MTIVCKHGLPTTWSIGTADFSEDHSLRQTITVRICQRCVEDGTAAAIAREIEAAVKRQVSQRLGFSVDEQEREGP